MNRIKLKKWHAISLTIGSCLLLSCGDPEEKPSKDSDEEDDHPSEETETETSSMTDGRPATLRGACPSKEEFGRFDLIYTDSQSSIDGTVKDGFAGSITEEVTASGSCRVLKKLVAFCDPECLSGQLCDETGTCIPYPLNQDVGTVTLFGAMDKVVLTPNNPSSNLYFNTSLAVPPFAPGAALTLSAEGGAFTPFTLYGTGFEILTSGDQEWRVSQGEAIQITWESGSTADAMIDVSINIDQHGNSPANIYCETPDTGSLTVPAELVDALIGLGISGKPSGMLERHTVDSVETDLSCVSFTVRSYLSVPVTLGTV